MKRCSEDTGKIQRKTLREEEDGHTDALLNGGKSFIRHQQCSDVARASSTIYSCWFHGINSKKWKLFCHSQVSSAFGLKDFGSNLKWQFGFLVTLK